jgi:signal transduction histidine kinase
MWDCVESTSAVEGKLPWLDQTSDLVLVVDRDRHIVAHSHRVEDALGYRSGELIARTIDSLIVSAPAELPRDRVAFAGDVQVFDRSGTLHPAELVLCPETNNVITIVRLAGMHTMTDQDIAEIVHDLKTPLSTIALETELLFVRAARAEQLERIERNVWYMDRLVHQLLDLCSLDHGILVMQHSPIELRSLLEGVIARVVPPCQLPRVRLEAPRRVVVACDEMRIERVVANFIENALKYAEPRSAIVIGLSDHATHARVSVTDTGPGIPVSELASLFDSHRRGSTSGGRHGSGLGLYISRKIIEAHHGRVGVDSVVGAGSQFFFELPVTMPDAAEPPKIRSLRDSDGASSRA